jgi:SAM-dependent methyltransferase
MKRYLSILREEEYRQLSLFRFSGTILDLGGCKKEGYHRIISSSEKNISTANMAGAGACDFTVDLEKPFSISSSSYENIICLNVLEHIFNFLNVVDESYRVLKPGGFYVLSVPFLFNIHGSPNDYFRYTKSSMEKMLSGAGFVEIEIKEIGRGFFSLVFQIIDGPGFVKAVWLRSFLKKLFVGMDILLSTLSHNYARLSLRIPLGYFIIAKKPR